MLNKCVYKNNLSLFIYFNSRTTVFLNWYKPNPSPLFFCCAIYVRDARYSSMIQLTYRELWISFKCWTGCHAHQTLKLTGTKGRKEILFFIDRLQASANIRHRKIKFIEQILNFRVYSVAFQLSRINIFWKTFHFTLSEGNTISEPTQWCKTRAFG